MTPAASPSIVDIFRGALDAAIPDTNLTVTAWANTYRYVSQGPEIGTKWRTSRVPFLDEILDCATDRRVREIVLWSSSRVGKTEGILNNIVGYFMHIDPCPIMMVQPTLDMAEKYSRDRLTSLIRETHVLRDLVDDPRSRDSGNTLLHKQFRGGHISIVGANSPVGLASEDIRVLLLDEVDRFPKTAGSEGDPISLAKVRTRNFRAAGDALVVMTSSPTIEGQSRIEEGYSLSDRCQLYLACPGCDELQIPQWSQVKWTELDLPPSQAVYVCPACGVIIDEDERSDMLHRYQWRSQVATESGVGHLTLDEWRSHPHFNGIAGFILPGLVSPFMTLGQMAEELTEATRAKSLSMKQVWVNTTLGELWKPWEEIDREELNWHQEAYVAEVPAGVVLMTAGTDVHPDRLETEVVGWGPGSESWSIDYKVFRGDTSKVEVEGEVTVWDELEDYYLKEWQHELGVGMKIRAACIDSGGHNTDSVYTFAKKASRSRRLWLAVKGASRPGLPIAPKKPSRVGRQNVNLYTVGTEVAKDRIASSLKVWSEPEDGTPGGPGACHFPERYEADYFDQLCAERAVTTFRNGYSVRRWQKIREGTRNEAFDCRVYALAAKEILSPNFKSLQERLLERVGAAQEAKLAAQNPKPEPKAKERKRDDDDDDGAPATPRRKTPPFVPNRPTTPGTFRIPNRRGRGW